MNRIVPALSLAALLLGASGGHAQERPLVVVDPGHGGEEIGVDDGGLLEKDLVLRIGFALGAELVAQDFDVRFTRSGDYAVSWDDRRGLAEREGAALLIMLHINGNEDRTRHGAEIYLDESNARSSAAAESIAQSLQGMGSAVLVEGRPWPFLQSASVPTVMLELAHMTHPGERRLVTSRTYHADLAAALTSAVRDIVSVP